MHPASFLSLLSFPDGAQKEGMEEAIIAKMVRRDTKKMGSNRFSEYCSTKIRLLMILIAWRLMSSATGAIPDDIVLQAMLRKELMNTMKDDVNWVEYMKIDAVAGSPLENMVGNNSPIKARLYEQDMLSLLHDAMVADWDEWVGSPSQVNNKLQYYQQALGSQDGTHKSILLISIFRQLRDVIHPKPITSLRWDENPSQEILDKKEEEGDDCKVRLFDDSEDGVLYKDKLWKSHFVRIIVKHNHRDVCILSFAVVAQKEVYNHPFVNKNLLSYVWPQIKFKFPHELPAFHGEERLLEMMLEGLNDVPALRYGSTGVLYQKVLLAPSQLSPYKFYIGRLLNEARLKSWKGFLDAKEKMPTTNFQIPIFSFYERRNPFHMRMVIAISRKFEAAPEETNTNPAHHSLLQESDQSVSLHRPNRNSERDECLSIINGGLLERTDVYEGYYVHIHTSRKKCIISYMIVECQDNFPMWSLFEKKPYENLLLNVINRVCPTNKLNKFIELTLS